MAGKKIGYIRVSSFDQNPERQLDSIALNKRFVDHCSGKEANRPQLIALFDYVREDDTVIIHSMDRLARNLDDLREIVQNLTNQKVRVQFIKEGLTFTGEDSPIAQLLLSVVGAVAEFERELIKERQLEGIALAKNRGAYKGRKRLLTKEKVAELKEHIAKGGKKSQIALALGISRETLYKYIKEQAL